MRSQQASEAEASLHKVPCKEVCWIGQPRRNEVLLRQQRAWVGKSSSYDPSGGHHVLVSFPRLALKSLN